MMEEQRIYERDGRTVTVFGLSQCVYLDEQPCYRVRMAGDFDLYFGDDHTVLKVEEDGRGISTVWYTPNDPELMENLKVLAALYREAKS